MNAFIDTSTLFKRYVSTEKGTQKLSEVLASVDEIIVAPTYIIEMHSIIRRLLHEKRIQKKEYDYLASQIERDYLYFKKIVWSETLEQRGVQVLKNYQLKTLDTIQIAAAELANANQVLTSDKKMYQICEKMFQKTVFI